MTLLIALFSVSFVSLVVVGVLLFLLYTTRNRLESTELALEEVLEELHRAQQPQAQSSMIAADPKIITDPLFRVNEWYMLPGYGNIYTQKVMPYSLLHQYIEISINNGIRVEILPGEVHAEDAS